MHNFMKLFYLQFIVVILTTKYSYTMSSATYNCACALDINICEINNMNMKDEFKLILNFQGKSSITHLMFSRFNRFPIFPENLFHDYKMLTRIDAHNCGINHFIISQKLEKSPIQHLILNYNNIIKLDEKTFSQLKALEILLIHHNFITKLTSRTFTNNLQLYHIDLSNNEIEDINESTFKNLRKLSILSLRFNRIKYLSQNLFKTNHELTSLRLNGNQIQYLEKYLFYYTKNLLWLFLDRNRIKLLPFDLLQFLKQNPKLKVFTIFGNDWGCHATINYVKTFESFSIQYGRDEEQGSLSYKGINCINVSLM